MGPTAFPEPRHDVADPAQLFVRYLDFFRGSVADKISAAVLLETRNRQARMEFLTAIVEQLLVDNKRARDAEAAAMNMQLGRLRDGRRAGLGLLAGAGDDLRSWKQP